MSSYRLKDGDYTTLENRELENLESTIAELLEALEAFMWAQDASDRNTGPRWNTQFLDEANAKALDAIHKAKKK